MDKQNILFTLLRDYLALCDIQDYELDSLVEGGIRQIRFLS